MNRKSTNTLRSTGAPLSILLAGIFGTLLLITSFSSAAPQSQGAPTLRIISEDGNRMVPIHHVIITGEDIAALPEGENRIIQKFGGGSEAAVTKVGTGMLVLTNDNSSFDLTKTGSGTLRLPNRGQGALPIKNKDNAVSKAGRLAILNCTLSGNTGYVVYEFRNLGPADFGSVLAPTEDRPKESLSLNFEEIKMSVQRDRPLSAMKGWPFKRLLIGTPRTIAQVEGWKPGAIKDSRPGSKYVCEGGFCQCNGSADCLSLVNSGSCSSNMNCDGTGNNTNCYCRSR